jgi:hypothetical protein
MKNKVTTKMIADWIDEYLNEEFHDGWQSDDSLKARVATKLNYSLDKALLSLLGLQQNFGELRVISGKQKEVFNQKLLEAAAQKMDAMIAQAFDGWDFKLSKANVKELREIAEDAYMEELQVHIKKAAMARAIKDAPDFVKSYFEEVK